MAKGTADTSLVKSAYSQVKYTSETFAEFQKCADTVTGPEYFLSKYMRIQHPTRGSIPLELYDFQEELLYNYHNFRYSINMLSRQMGKSTVAAGYLLWYAMFVPDSTILIASNKGANASEIMQRVRYAYENTPDHIRAGVVEYNKGSITFDNGSRIVGTTTTETTGRGMSISLVYLDEFAFVRNSIAKEFWTSLSPTLSTGGKCIITSTPNTDEDTFANIWHGANKLFDEYGNERDIGQNGFKSYIATWDRHPDRDDAWARDEEARIGSERFNREHLCRFITYEETLINPLKLVEMTGVEPASYAGQVRWYKKPSPIYSYVITLDPSAGTGGDSAGIQVLELPTLVQVAEWQHNKTPVEGQIKVLMDIMQYIRDFGAHQMFWTVENNSIGEAALVVIRDTGEENFPGEFLSEPVKVAGKRGRRGFTTTHKSKIEACVSLKRYIEQGKLTVNSKALISELKNFVAKGNSYAAKPGETDDLVMSLVLAIRVISYVSTFDDDVYNRINSSIGLSDIMGGVAEDDEPMPMSFL